MNLRSNRTNRDRRDASLKRATYVTCVVCGKLDEPNRDHMYTNIGTAKVMRCRDCAGAADGRATRCRDCCPTWHGTRFDGRMNMTCPRCHKESTVSTCSYFTTDDICLECKAEERSCPNFKRAYDAETEAVRSGQYNFTGIGLAPEDEAHLTQRRKERSSRR